MISYCWRKVNGPQSGCLESGTKYLEGTLKLRVNREKSGWSVYSQSEILSSLAFVMGRTEKEYISESMGSHGRKPRINCAGSLPGAGAGA